MSTDEPFAITDPITTDAGTFRAKLFYDPDAESPRDWSNVGTLVISHRRVVGVDEDRDASYALGEYDHGHGAISLRAACRYVRLATGARVVLPVQVHENWANEYVAGTGDASDEGMSVDGFTFDTPSAVAECMGAGDDVTDEAIAEALREELATYGRWAAGEFVGIVIERLDDPDDDADPDDDDAAWTETEDGSVWGIDSEDYARELAEETIRGYRAQDYPPPALAAQV